MNSTAKARSARRKAAKKRFYSSSRLFFASFAPSRLSLFLSENNSTPSEVVRGEFYLHAIAREDADEMLAHFSGDDAEDFLVGIVELQLEHRVGQRLRNRRFNLNGLGLGHKHSPENRRLRIRSNAPILRTNPAPGKLRGISAVI